MSGKCCRSCAFMVCNEWRNGFLSAPGHQRQESATAAFRSAVLHGSLTLIGQRLRDWDEYAERYRIAELQHAPGEAYLRGLSLSPFASYDKWEEYGLPEPPVRPPADEWLSCWHAQWTEGRVRADAVCPTFLNSHSCDFYFPFDRKGKRDLDGCEKQRVHELDKGRYVLNVIITVSTALLASSLLWEIFKN